MIDWNRLGYATYIVAVCAIAVVVLGVGVFFLVTHAPWATPILLFGLLVFMVYTVLGDEVKPNLPDEVKFKEDDESDL